MPKKPIITPKELVDESLQLIDRGFDRLGRRIEGASHLDRYMIAATYKAIRFSKAMVVLCEQNLTDEALPILRSLIEHSINMRWIIITDSQNRLKQYMNDLGEKGFGAPWSEKALDQRMNEVGFGNRDYYDYCVKVVYSYAHVNASSLVWGEVYSDPRLSKEKWSSNAIYVVVAQMLGHVLKALNSHFSGKFEGYEDIDSQIKVDKNIRKKIEKIRKSFEEVN